MTSSRTAKGRPTAAAARPGYLHDQDTTELIELIATLHARGRRTPIDKPGRVALAQILETAVDSLTAGLPDVDCQVSLAALPDIRPELGLGPAEITDARSRLLTWLSGVAQQLTLGRAVTRSYGAVLRKLATAG